MPHIQPNTHLPKTPKIKVYTALMTQTGTNAPVATILQNNLGNIIWERLTNGQYQGTLTNAFIENQTALTPPQLQTNGGTTLLFRTGISTIALQTYNGAAFADDLLTKCFIEIRLYNNQPIDLI